MTRGATGARVRRGDLVLLDEQDRSPLGSRANRRGLAAPSMRRSAARALGPPYAIQAAIAALHAQRTNGSGYRLAANRRPLRPAAGRALSQAPLVELNHAVAVAMVDGPARALDLIDALEARGGLKGYELLPAVRADLLRRLGRRDAAREAYLAATAATQLEPLRRLYARRMRGDGERSDRALTVIARRSEKAIHLSARG